MPEKPGTRVKWYRCRVPREELAQLNKRSDLKGFLQTGGYLLLIVATAAAAIWSWYNLPWYLTVGVFFIHGTFAMFTINAHHELVHDSVFKTKWLNGFFLRIFTWWGLWNHHWFWASHTEHHKYTLHPPDDLEVTLRMDVSKKTFLRGAIIDPMSIWWTFRNLIRVSFGKFDGDWTHHLFYEGNPARKKYINWARFLLLSHGLLFAVCMYFGWYAVPLAITFSRFYGGWLQFLCNQTQHAGLKDNTDDYRLCCRTMYLNPFFQFLYWHMNYHTEHHMYAAVPCYNLGRLHRLIKDDMPDCPRGLWVTWRQIWAIQKRQKTDPGFQYVPELPTPGPDDSPPTPLFESELRPAAV